MAQKHWLVETLEGAGYNGGELDLEQGAPIAEAWEKAAQACGISQEEVAVAVSSQFGLPLADLSKVEPKAINFVIERVARRYVVFPIREDDRHLVVATCDPTDLEIEHALAFASGRAAQLEIAPPGQILEMIETQYSPDRAVESFVDTLMPEDVLMELGDSDDAVRVVEDASPEEVAAEEADAAPVIRLSNLILRDAVQQGASDIHIEPGRQAGTVRFRVDGVLRQYMQMPMPALNRVVSRIKILGELDISDRLRPQDGRVRVGINRKFYDLRISTVPTREAEKVVIRILDPESSVELTSLGLPEKEMKRLERLMANREGIFIVTGPTGSGKTTTLYAALRELATGEVNVMTVEDPVEYELAGITQMQVENKRGFTFATALRAILRQDPDVIFVGEIRDEETAEIAVQASMTGHFVLATLHTNDALGVIQRLADLGLDRPSLAESLRGSIAQRLVRKVCEECCEKIGRKKLTDDEERLNEKYGVKPTVRAVGCDKCGGSGYRGRMPLMEILTITPKVRELIAKGASISEIQRAAKRAGMKPLRDMALDRVKNGATTLAELERVLGEPIDELEEEREGTRVLMVDDDDVDRKLAVTLLEKSGFEVEEASNGAQAVKILETDSDFDLVILDLQMPKMDGREVLKDIRSTPTTVGLPVLVLTGSEDVETEVELMERGADDYIRKPIDPPRFVARVKAALRRAGLQVAV